MKFRTTVLAAALVTAGASCLAMPAQAAHFGGWNGGGWHGGWHEGWHGGWHGGGWSGAGIGFAAGAIVGSALAAPYYDGYDGYYTAGYGYPDYYDYDAPVAYGYGYDYAPVVGAYDYDVAPSYGFAYGPAYTTYGAVTEPAWGYGERRIERRGYERRYGYSEYNRGRTYASYGTSVRTHPSVRGEYRTRDVRGEYRAGAVRGGSHGSLYAHYQGSIGHSTRDTGFARMNAGASAGRANANVHTGASVGHSNAAAGTMNRGRQP